MANGFTKEWLDEQLRKTTPARCLDDIRTHAEDEAVPAGTELALHSEIMKECRRRGWVYVYHDPTKRTGATLGTPDFIIYAAFGRVLNVECKTATGKLSKDQQKFEREIIRNGHLYHEVRSLKRFLEIANIKL